MLKKINRLTKDKDFNNVFNPPTGGGRSGYDKTIGIKVASNNLEHNRFGILISTKVSKKAVERNKIKRQIRETIRLQQEKLKQGHDCVVICLPDIVGKTYKEIEGSINKQFKKLKLYK